MVKNVEILSFTANFENISLKFSKFHAYIVGKISRLQKDYIFQGNLAKLSPNSESEFPEIDGLVWTLVRKTRLVSPIRPPHQIKIKNLKLEQF
jgi:hypothetical protein